MFNTKLIITLLFTCLIGIDSSIASTTKISSGDDGSDLEGFTAVTSGKLVDTKKKAIALVKKQNAAGIKGLGQLPAEIEQAPIYLTKKDVDAQKTDKGVYHSDMQGLVFARTYAEPNAATRFFPVAEKLDEDQLVALHIHEALHRALPESVREDEQVVSAITLAMTSPEASHDRVNKVVTRNIPEEVSDSPTSMAAKYPIPENAKVKRPSTLAYSYKRFTKDGNQLNGNIGTDSMHTLQSHLYPFGTDTSPLGIGIELGLLNGQQGTDLGPLLLSARMRLWSSRGFDISGWGTASLNTLSSEELKKSPFGRDVYTLGLSMEKNLKYFYVENLISISSGSESKQKIINIEYTHSFGSIVNASVRAGFKILGFKVGGFGEIYLADYYKLKGGAFSDDTGRFQVIGVGPEVSIETGDLTFSVFGRFLASSTKDTNFEYLGNMMGPGMGRGSIGASLAINL